MLRDQRSIEWVRGYTAAQHEIEEAYSRGYEEGQGGSALAPFVFLGFGLLVGLALGALL